MDDGNVFLPPPFPIIFDEKTHAPVSTIPSSSARRISHNAKRKRPSGGVARRPKSDIPSSVEYALMGLGYFCSGVQNADPTKHRMIVWSQSVWNEYRHRKLDTTDPERQRQFNVQKHQEFCATKARLVRVSRNETQGRSCLSFTVATPAWMIWRLAQREVFDLLLEKQEDQSRLGDLLGKIYDIVGVLGPDEEVEFGHLKPKKFLNLVDYMMVVHILHLRSPNVSIYEHIVVSIADNTMTRHEMQLGQLVPKGIRYAIDLMQLPYFNVLCALYNGQAVCNEVNMEFDPADILMEENGFRNFLGSTVMDEIDRQVKMQLNPTGEIIKRPRLAEAKANTGSTTLSFERRPRGRPKTRPISARDSAVAQSNGMFVQSMQDLAPSNMLTFLAAESESSSLSSSSILPAFSTLVASSMATPAMAPAATTPTTVAPPTSSSSSSDSPPDERMSNLFSMLVDEID